MANDIQMYINSVFCGFWELDVIEEFFDDFHKNALQLSKIIDWDEIILFAIYNYDSEKQALISADFMNIRMNYDRYVMLANALSNDCRLFFVSNI